ncbi:MbnP family copper-binding protein [Chondromyces crocatus]|nr:MbnP family copper-binding protein [Chondromyces crocatus]
MSASLSVGCGGDDDGGSSDTTTTTSSGEGGAGGTGGTGGVGGTGGTGGSGGDGAGGGGTQQVELRFDGRVGDEAFDCSATYTGLGTTASEVRFTDFRLYIHDVRLISAESGDEVRLELEQDGLWQYQDLVLLDFENRTGACTNGTTDTNGVVRGTAPAGSYDGVVFKLGVPAALNHGDAAAAPSPLNLTAMFWNWQGGYKFVRVDSVPTGAPTAFNLHLGSTNCVGDPAAGESVTCERPNVIEVTLRGFDPLNAPVFVDYAGVIEANDLSTNAGGAPGCMSGIQDPECAPIFERLGLDIAQGTFLPTQQFFRVE